LKTSSDHKPCAARGTSATSDSASRPRAPRVPRAGRSAIAGDSYVPRADDEDRAGDHGYVRILVLTTFENDENVLHAVRAGASGFLGKNVGPDELLHAVRVVATGDAFLSPKATRGLVQHVLEQPEAVARPTAALDQLTDREREVVVLVAHGLSNDDIAERLYLSPLTAKTHVNRAMTKLSVRDRAQLVVIAYENGLIRPGQTPP
jgi:DNA-binding NarL/FixJ family response regulator